MIQRIKPLPLVVVLPGSEGEQQTNQNISFKVENEQIYFHSNVSEKIAARDTPTIEKRSGAGEGKQQRTF